MAYQKQNTCIYCGKQYATIHSSKTTYSSWGSYHTTTTNGHADGSSEAIQASNWCGQCEKTIKISESLKKYLKSLVKNK